MRWRLLLWSVCVLAGGLVAGPARALTPQQALALSTGEVETRVAAMRQLLAGADLQTVALIQALADDAVKATPTAVYVMKDGKEIGRASCRERVLMPV